VLDYIKSSIEILVSINSEKKLEEYKAKESNKNVNSVNNDFTDEEVNVYEKSLRQLEAEIRNHVKVCMENEYR
jgi:hypothetical protein